MLSSDGGCSAKQWGRCGWAASGSSLWACPWWQKADDPKEMTAFLPFPRPSIDEATIAAVAGVLRSGWITSGPKVKELEAALSARCGGRPVRVLNSATAALELALRICRIGR